MQLPSYRPLTLAELRERRRRSQTDLAGIIGVDRSSVSRLEVSQDPKLSSLDAFCDALGVRLVLVAVVPHADGKIERHLLRIAGDTRRDVAIDILSANRWRPPLTSRPASESFRARTREATE